ncbi:MAG: hypothetical protein EOO38_15355 [Cytophagaceae bacterium]|nr:MAG: hypothetical protein EOO38_15355 [Cytophagaceae bacterium]
MKRVLLLLMSFVLLLSACKKEENEKDLEGVWVEKMITTKFAGTRHWIQFNADLTFNMKLDYFSDAIDTEPVPCPANRTEYLKGSYQMADGKITFTGNYCDASFSNYVANCSGTEQYTETFTTTFKGKDLVLDFEKEDPYQNWLFASRQQYNYKR